MHRTTAAALAALALASCGKGCTRTAGGPIDVAPLPEPPAIQAAHEALAGAGGELAVGRAKAALLPRRRGRRCGRRHCAPRSS
jgi:hypothetical protein